MSSFKISTDQQAYVACNVGPAVDREGNPQADQAGIPLWEVRAVSLPEQEPGRDRPPMPEIVRVQVAAAAEPRVSFGDSVVFQDLTARTWAARDGRMGIMYSAVGIKARPGGASATDSTGR